MTEGREVGSQEYGIEGIRMELAKKSYADYDLP